MSPSLNGPVLSPAAHIVRRYDPDRFFASLFAAPDKRESLMLLYALNHELVRAREVASTPIVALIRLQWWREVVEGVEKRHELATPLGEALKAGQLDREGLLALIEAREADMEESFPDSLTLWHYLEQTAGQVAVLAGQILGAGKEEQVRLRRLGAIYGLAGVVHGVCAHAAQGRVLVPVAELHAAGLEPEALTSAPHEAGNIAAGPLQALATEGQRRLRLCRGRVGRGWMAAALPAVLARRDLARPIYGRINPSQRGLGDRLAVLIAALTGRI
ncbi:Phytoene synthase family protein [Granulibacter bethesdensis]|uniref:squalene/phytoene synthase family protein n=1 Tax=Granulibacter bethesdensis TaxID=364410 RepID=UPI00090C4487|nr:squalene/phytoene synthase family protein [Granulibacter bethesdensis]APH56773.1 Phytoene synthase family protein [Granulibacter bethesdensis]